MCRSPFVEGEAVCRDSGTQRDDRRLRQTSLKPSVGSLWMGESTARVMRDAGTGMSARAS